MLIDISIILDESVAFVGVVSFLFDGSSSCHLSEFPIVFLSFLVISSNCISRLIVLVVVVDVFGKIPF